MNYKFVPMNEVYANTIIKNWHYPNQYAIYNYTNEADHILNTEIWGQGLFAVINQNNNLIGELTIQFFDENDNFIEHNTLTPEKLAKAEMWIGFGLKPELTGCGLGVEFVSACVKFAIKHHTYPGEYIRLGVATFNQRAIKVYKRVGFEIFKQTEGEINGKIYEVVQMRKKLRPSKEQIQ